MSNKQSKSSSLLCRNSTPYPTQTPSTMPKVVTLRHLVLLLVLTVLIIMLTYVLFGFSDLHAIAVVQEEDDFSFSSSSPTKRLQRKISKGDTSRNDDQRRQPSPGAVGAFSLRRSGVKDFASTEVSCPLRIYLFPINTNYSDEAIDKAVEYLKQTSHVNHHNRKKRRGSGVRPETITYFDIPRLSFPMDGYHFDSILYIMLKNHRCLTEDPAKADIGFVPFLSQTLRVTELKTHAFTVFQSVLEGIQNRPEFAEAYRVLKYKTFIFTPSYTSPSPMHKYLVSKLPHWSVIVHEVGLFGLRTGTKRHPTKRLKVHNHEWFGEVIDPSSFLLEHFWDKKRGGGDEAEIKYLCRRHMIVPQLEWNILEPVSPFLCPPPTSLTTNDMKMSYLMTSMASHSTAPAATTPPCSRQVLLYFFGRQQTVEREHLYQEAIYYRNLTNARSIANKRNATENGGGGGGGDNNNYEVLFEYDEIEESKKKMSDTYMKGMESATFCVDTTGDLLMTKRISSAVLCGCIPVLICHHCLTRSQIYSVTMKLQ